MVGDSDNRSGKLTPRHHVPMWGEWEWDVLYHHMVATMPNKLNQKLGSKIFFNFFFFFDDQFLSIF